VPFSAKNELLATTITEVQLKGWTTNGDEILDGAQSSSLWN
jgi:hypothetical protein